jgi:hypothetical protein
VGCKVKKRAFHTTFRVLTEAQTLMIGVPDAKRPAAELNIEPATLTINR